mmetsp:Transcript_24440/g.43369  ORF Transcript_24440/g.43369 Transcript_24440/m.43369 type:complete len:215 (+) Transcript_24440:100-744(+)
MLLLRSFRRRVSRVQMERGIRVLSSNPDEVKRKRIDQAFDRIDLNSDGVISKEEFFAAYGQAGTTTFAKQIIDASDWPTVQPGTCAKDVAKIMAGSKTGWAVVTGDPEDVSDIVGIVTERDIIRKALSSDTGDVTSMDVGDIMTPKAKLITVSASDSVWEITRVFIDKGIRAAPVLDEGQKLVGFVHVRDAVAQLVTDHSNEMLSINEYLHGSY